MKRKLNPLPLKSSNRRVLRRGAGFTLVELLVVIGIIALLISILLPALSKAQKAARSLVCLANLRSICQAMNIYASQNKGYFPGGGSSSAAGMANDENNFPNLCQIWDWQSPIADTMGFDFNHGSAISDRTDRYVRLSTLKAFTCPENQYTAIAFGTSVVHVPTGPMISYNTAAAFQYLPTPSNGSADDIITGKFVSNPGGYSPKLTSVGSPARKIYVADGSRYSNYATPPDVDLNVYGTQGGAYSDYGAYSAFSKSWDRKIVPGNGGGGIVGWDGRVHAYRHGPTQTGSAGGTWRFNAGFFDGHAEAMDDLTGANPELWLPTGAKVASWSTEAWPDVVSRWPANSGSDYVSP